jgi:quinol monooxygenase YgiN
LIIIAGALYVDPRDRDRYLATVSDVATQARLAPGCLDFVQAPDLIEPERINIYERWESDADVHRFRDSGGPGLDVPPIRSADVHKYRISAVEGP